MNVKIPPSTARVQVEKAGAQAVAAKAITQAQLDALLKDPVLDTAERNVAGQMLGAVRALQSPRLDKAKNTAMTNLAVAVHNEVAVKDRIRACQKALAGGAIDEAMYARLTSPVVGFRGRVGLYVDARNASREVKRLADHVAGASGDKAGGRRELEGKLQVAQERSQLISAIANSGFGSSAEDRKTLARAINDDIDRFMFRAGSVVGTIAVGSSVFGSGGNWGDAIALNLVVGVAESVLLGLGIGSVAPFISMLTSETFFSELKAAPPNTPVPA